ncbi:hypothetical protein [Sporosarcina sp. BI001-red]|uniref:hypothetical protein n=1 Tax=Sporosarcina sp. BI001-red TaxID=2282866 RepID=UPI0011C01BAC|nr:hypothetical protein [Sporosarcina sp. BI001-red]
MKEKIVQDGNQKLSWQSYIWIGVGVLIGIVIVSTIKHGEINWMSIGRATGVGAFLFFIYFLLLKGKRRVEQKE